MLPKEVEVNEDFGDWEPDFDGEDWPPGIPNGKLTRWSGFYDIYGAEGVRIPMPVNPGAPGCNVEVQHATQWYRAGSIIPGDGRLIKTVTLQRYRGKARQEQEE